MSRIGQSRTRLTTKRRPKDRHAAWKQFLGEVRNSSAGGSRGYGTAAQTVSRYRFAAILSGICRGSIERTRSPWDQPIPDRASMTRTNHVLKVVQRLSPRRTERTAATVAQM